jgi:hypothetical protein
MVRIDEKTESLLSIAVGLVQSGILRSTVHFYDDNLYIVNMDKSIIMNFRLEDHFPPFSFYADDFESPRMEVDCERGFVTFLSSRREGNWIRNKTCPFPTIKSDEVHHRFQKLWEEFPASDQDCCIKLYMNSRWLNLINKNLPHVEFSSSGYIIQRDLYSGNQIHILHSTKGPSLLSHEDQVKISNRIPIGIRTSDLITILTFCKSGIELRIPTDHSDHPPRLGFFTSQSPKMRSIIGMCWYDEMLDSLEDERKEENENGREKPQSLIPQRKIDTEIEKNNVSTLGIQKASTPSFWRRRR